MKPFFKIYIYFFNSKLVKYKKIDVYFKERYCTDEVEQIFY